MSITSGILAKSIAQAGGGANISHIMADLVDVGTRSIITIDLFYTGVVDGSNPPLSIECKESRMGG